MTTETIHDQQIDHAKHATVSAQVAEENAAEAAAEKAEDAKQMLEKCEATDNAVVDVMRAISDIESDIARVELYEEDAVCEEDREDARKEIASLNAKLQKAIAVKNKLKAGLDANWTEIYS